MSEITPSQQHRGPRHGRISADAPPTEKQVAAMQALMVHRTNRAAAKSLGIAEHTLWFAANGCAKRAAGFESEERHG